MLSIINSQSKDGDKLIIMLIVQLKTFTSNIKTSLRLASPAPAAAGAAAAATAPPPAGMEANFFCPVGETK
jgi:hypothetical protein